MSIKEMSRFFFESEIERLCRNFNDRYAVYYTDDRIRLIWNEVKCLESDDFVRIIDKFISSSKSSPKVEEFAEIAKFYQSHKSYSDDTDGLALQIEYSTCTACAGAGLMSVIDKTIYKNDYLFRCKCPAGTHPNLGGKYPVYPQWRTETHNEKFTVNYKNKSGVKAQRMSEKKRDEDNDVT